MSCLLVTNNQWKTVILDSCAKIWNVNFLVRFRMTHAESRDHFQRDRATAATSKIHGLKCQIDPRLDHSNISLVFAGEHTAIREVQSWPHSPSHFTFRFDGHYIIQFVGIPMWLICDYMVPVPMQDVVKASAPPDDVPTVPAHCTAYPSLPTSLLSILVENTNIKLCQ